MHRVKTDVVQDPVQAKYLIKSTTYKTKTRGCTGCTGKMKKSSVREIKFLEIKIEIKKMIG